MPPMTREEREELLEAGRREGRLDAARERFEEVSKELKDGMDDIKEQLAKIATRLATGEIMLQSVGELNTRLTVVERQCAICVSGNGVMRKALEGEDTAVKLQISKRAVAGLATVLTALGGVVGYVLKWLSTTPHHPGQ